MPSKTSNTVAGRLRQLRQAKGYRDAISFATFLGLRRSHWGNLENGYPLTRDMALLLIRKVPGLSLDWLYLGRVEGLSIPLARQLGISVDAPASPRRNSTK